MYEPLAGSTFTNLLRLLAQNRFDVSFRYLPRTLYALSISGFISLFRLKELMKYEREIETTTLKEPPLFILGHWRSGTTYLHNVLSMDTSFGYCSTFNATVPGVFLGSEKRIKPILKASIPEKRPMDDVAMGADLPQEEEYAIGALSPYAYYNGWCFPRNMAMYNRYVCLDDVSAAVVNEWKDTYSYFLKKLTFYREGKRLVLKNPANTARIKHLLDIYPDAQFAHIYRHPYEIYYSMMKFMRIAIPRYCIQRPPRMDIIERDMMDLYAKIYRRYLSDYSLIPEENLVEIRYDDFIISPLSEMKRMYRTLGIKGFSKVQDVMDAYVKTQKTVKTSTYKMDDSIKERVYQKWKFTFDAFGFEP